ncbi:MAG TPA: protein translocase subunit SecD [Planctomycetes bacterium]|nr:protein translocase subunit SecD [Planctomycetota bacterium]
MLDHVARKITAIVVFLLISVLFLVLKDPPFQLGLDLQGGTRLVYSVDFDAAYADGRLDRSENEVQVLEQIIQIIRNRVDPDGLLEPIIRAGGRDRIIIELPGTLGLPSKEAKGELAEPMTEGSDEIHLVDASDFPESGVVVIGHERIRYNEKIGNTLRVEKDGAKLTGRAVKSPLETHAASDEVTLEKDDAFRAKIESLGELSFQIVATAADMPPGTDLANEKEKLKVWAEAHPNAPLSAFNRLSPEEGGPDPSIEWFPQKAYTEAMKAASPADIALPVFRPKTESEKITGAALSRVYPTRDDFGYPAVGFEIQPSRRSDFGEFTGSNKGKQMAIILNGEIFSAPSLDVKLVSGGRIQGRFTDEEVKNLMTVLRSGSLKIKPKIENDERVGATLGDDYVRRGEISGVIALLSVLLFVILYYRRLGIYAAISLILSFVMLLGALSFGNATLTLPGIAGIILTIGMAVDANILIFDRIREEMDRGRNVKQAAREGFEKASPAILDANITTFLTALILRFVGTGPVRGFAVTLMWGIITSVFAALVTTRVLVHFDLVKGAKKYNVGQWFVTANFAFMKKAKIALGTSLTLILLGVGLFAVTPDAERFGIDFLGGVEAQLRTAKPESVDLIREKIKAIPVIGESADVKSIIESAEGDGYTMFRATFKTADGSGDIAKDSDVRALLTDALEGILLERAVQVELDNPDGGSPTANVTLLFAQPHPTADIAAVVEKAGLENPVVETTPTPNEYKVTAGVAVGMTAEDLTVKLQGVLGKETDSSGSPFQFADGIPSYSSVGGQVVGELRDQALLAMLFSLFVIVLYIRVRFAEYSYGFAAVMALLHDVLITLGALTLANKLGILNGEINLPIIAAFLTIIGYSLNDTIVIFDRVRENLPRMKKPFAEVLNISINQTLSRTVLTSFTTFLAVAILYVFNMGTGNVLETFSFAMMVGVITGTYSTIYVANPLLVWLEGRSGRLTKDGIYIPADAQRTSKGKGSKQEAQLGQI